MTTGPRPPAGDGMGLLHSTLGRRIRAFVPAIAVLALVLGPSWAAANGPAAPAQAMTVTVDLDRAAYLTGDLVQARVIVYRTPIPANYTFGWEVRDPLLRVLNATSQGNETFQYRIPLDYPGASITVQATADDGQGGNASGSEAARVDLAVMALRLDRGDFLPGDTIVASYSVLSNVIRRPTYDYEVDDSSSTIVRSGNTNATSFAFRTPIPASPSYAFLVTAREGANRTQAEVTIDQAAGILLAVSFDRPAYAPGETIRAHLALTARGLSRLPRQFDWLLTLGPPFGTSFGARAITTEPEVDLSLPIPSGLGGGDVLVVAFESSTGASQYVTLHIGSTNPLWSTEVGGIPLFATLLALLFLLIFVAVIGLWRRIASVPPAAPLLGVTTSAPPAEPSPPPAAPSAPGPAPMSVACAHCGQPIELTTSRRPIEVMCPSCGETQLVG